MGRFEYRADAERILSRQPGVVSALGTVTKRVENEAERAARPVSRRFADELDSTGGVDTQGAYGRVNANWWGSLFVEFGTRTQPARAILRRALDSAKRTR